MKINLNYTIYHGKSELNRFSINSIDVNSNKNILVTCGKDFLIKIWDLDFIGKCFFPQNKIRRPLASCVLKLS